VLTADRVVRWTTAAVGIGVGIGVAAVAVAPFLVPARFRKGRESAHISYIL
jgi:hypothetical protein